MSTETIRTLFLDANGFGTQVIWADTLLRGVLRLEDGAQPGRLARRIPPLASLYPYLRQQFGALSYVLDWRDAVRQHPRLQVDVCNIMNLVEYGGAMLRIRDYDLVIVSHAASGDDMSLLRRTARFVERRRGKLAVFIGNEYDLLDEKIGFLRDTGADIVCSQLPLEAAQYLYGDCGGTRIVSIPHALNPDVYRPGPAAARSVDVGFIGDIYWPFIGDRERTDLIEAVRNQAPQLGLNTDIRTARIDRHDWSRFLQGTRAIVGAESGTYYLNDRGAVLNAARHYNLDVNRAASFDEVFERFFAGLPRISGKCISSRHFEPIGTKTAQVLLEGDYNGVLVPDEHYFAVRKDLSNLDEVLRRLADETARQEMVDRTYDYVLANHTYRNRVDTLVHEVGA